MLPIYNVVKKYVYRMLDLYALNSVFGGCKSWRRDQFAHYHNDDSKRAQSYNSHDALMAFVFSFINSARAAHLRNLP